VPAAPQCWCTWTHAPILYVARTVHTHPTHTRAHVRTHTHTRTLARMHAYTLLQTARTWMSACAAAFVGFDRVVVTALLWLMTSHSPSLAIMRRHPFSGIITCAGAEAGAGAGAGGCDKVAGERGKEETPQEGRMTLAPFRQGHKQGQGQQGQARKEGSKDKPRRNKLGGALRATLKIGEARARATSHTSQGL